jgi:ATP-dependent Lon protease
VFCDVAAAGLLKRVEDRQSLLECADCDERLKLMLRTLAEEVEIGALEEKIQQKVREYMDRANHEYYLREQIRVIQDELGADEDEEIAELRSRLGSFRDQEGRAREERRCNCMDKLAEKKED